MDKIKYDQPIIPTKVEFDYDTFDIDTAYSDLERLEKIGTGKIKDVKKIIRWILFGTNLYPRYHKHEITYYFAPFCKNNPANKRLSFCY